MSDKQKQGNKMQQQQSAKSRMLNELDHNYQKFLTAHPHAAQDFTGAVEDLLADAGIAYDRVTARVKSWRSLKAKACKKLTAGTIQDGDAWGSIHDRIGVRVTTYCSTEIPKVTSVLGESFVILKQTDKTAETKISGSFGYGSHHLIAQVGNRVEDLLPYEGFVFEVQVRTVLQHAWAEFEHDIRYKGGNQDLDPRVDRAFTLTAGLIELADQQFDQISAIHDKTTTQPGHDVELTAETLPGILVLLLGARFPRSKYAYYSWLEEILAANGITTVGELTELLNDKDIKAVQRCLNYRFVPGQVRIIDDLLLRRFGHRHIVRTGHTGTRSEARPARLEKRLEQMIADGIADDQ